MNNRRASDICDLINDLESLANWVEEAQAPEVSVYTAITIDDVDAGLIRAAIEQIEKLRRYQAKDEP